MGSVRVYCSEKKPGARSKKREEIYTRASVVNDRGKFMRTASRVDQGPSPKAIVV
jgi:hypothetical protein